MNKRKPRRKLQLTTETLCCLEGRQVAGGLTQATCNQPGCNGQTLWATCTDPTRIPSVDDCDSQGLQCITNAQYCVSGHATCVCL